MLLFDDQKKLEKALGEEAASIIIKTFEKYDEKTKSELPTKGDLREEVNAVRADVRETELRLQAEIEKAKYSLLKWQIGIGIALVIIMAKGFGWLGF